MSGVSAMIAGRAVAAASPPVIGAGSGAVALACSVAMIAVAVGLVYNYLPLFILPVFASLERMDWTLIEAATDLGARPFTAFREITLRLTLPGVVTGALLVFIPMTGEYVIPAILSGGKYEFVGNVIGDTFNTAQNPPFGSALAISLMVALSIFVFIYILFATREERFGA